MASTYGQIRKALRDGEFDGNPESKEKLVADFAIRDYVQKNRASLIERYGADSFLMVRYDSSTQGVSVVVAAKTLREACADDAHLSMAQGFRLIEPGMLEQISDEEVIPHVDALSPEGI